MPKNTTPMSGEKCIRCKQEPRHRFGKTQFSVFCTKCRTIVMREAWERDDREREAREEEARLEQERG